MSEAMGAEGGEVAEAGVSEAGEMEEARAGEVAETGLGKPGEAEGPGGG
ncbi:hypothetical protein [Actinorhabdospora filicis]|nr:hypothetical protein [Actinorhabdospora filicis]